MESHKKNVLFCFELPSLSVCGVIMMDFDCEAFKHQDPCFEARNDWSAKDLEQLGS